MNAVLQNFCSRLASLGFSVFAQDKAPAKDGWITVKPNGPEHKGQHVEIDDETGGVKKGFGGKFKGQKISEIRSKFRGPQVNRLAERPDRKPEPSPMRTPAPQTSAGQKLGGRLQDVLQKRQQEMEKNQPETRQVVSKTPVTKEQLVERIKAMSADQKEQRENELEGRLREYIFDGKKLSDTELRNLVIERTIFMHGLSAATVPGYGSDVFNFWVDQQYGQLKGAPERAHTANPSEIAGVKRGKAMTPKTADGDSVNPDYEKSENYKINCQSCAFAYELRRRGYNVEAKPRGSVADGGSGEWGDKLSRRSSSAFINIMTGEPPVGFPLTSKNTRSRAGCMRMLKELDSVVGPNERYAFTCVWKGTTYGHIFNIEKDNKGKLYLIDSQSGDFLVGKKQMYEKYFSRVSEMSIVSVFRTDNTKIIPEFSHVLKEARS